MESKSYQIGIEGLKKIAEAFGMEDRPLQRIIIEANVDGMVTIYTQQIVTEKELDTFLDIVVKGEPVREKTQRKINPKLQPNEALNVPSIQPPLELPGIENQYKYSESMVSKLNMFDIHRPGYSNKHQFEHIYDPNYYQKGE